VFRELYGVGPFTVHLRMLQRFPVQWVFIILLTFTCIVSDNEDVLRVLDTYATVRSTNDRDRGGNRGPFYDAFNELITLLQQIDKDCIPGELLTTGTPLCGFYWLFWSTYSAVKN
jgi:hypothetical protein